MHILIVCNNSNAGAVAASRELADHLSSRGIRYSTTASFDLPRKPSMPVGAEDDSQGMHYREGYDDFAIDLVVVLGGDGTVLRAARMVATSGVPIIGINFGHLGFLSNPCDDGVAHIVDAALAGEVEREERSNLHVDVTSLEETDLEDDSASSEGISVVNSYFALNEMAVTRGALGRVIDLSVRVDGHRFVDIRGDGMVVASATGSTAYALSAGGPLVAPSHRGLVVVPIASHSLSARAVVTAPGEAVEVDMCQNDATRAAAIFVDGNVLHLSGSVQSLKVRTGTCPTTLLRYGYEGFYSYAAKTFL